MAVAALAAACLPAWGAVATPAAADSAVNLVDCAGTETTTFKPGLTNTPRKININIENDLFICLHVGAPDPFMTGTSTSKLTRTFSCTDLLGGGPGQRLINWTDGTSSTFAFTSSANVVGGNLIVAMPGTITAGRYAGSTAVGEVILEGLEGILGACDTQQGLTSVSGAFSFQVAL